MDPRFRPHDCPDLDLAYLQSPQWFATSTTTKLTKVEVVIILNEHCGPIQKWKISLVKKKYEHPEV